MKRKFLDKMREDLERENESVKVWLGQLSKSESTRKNSLYALYRFILWRAKKTLKDELTLDEIKMPDQLIDEAWKAQRSDDRLIATKARRDLIEFSQIRGGGVMCSYMKSFYLRNDVPITNLVLNRDAPKREEVFPEDNKIYDLIRRCHSAQLRSFVWFLVESGARDGSVAKLQYKHIRKEFEAGVSPCAIFFPLTITKGNIPYIGFIGSDAIKALREYLDERRRSGEKITDISYLFASRNQQKLSITTLIGRIQDQAKRAGIIVKPKGTNDERTLYEFRPHMLRDRFKTRVRDSGVIAEILDRLTGSGSKFNREAMKNADNYYQADLEKLRENYIRAYPKVKLASIETKAELVAEKEQYIRSVESRMKYFEDIVLTYQDIQEDQDAEFEEMLKVIGKDKLEEIRKRLREKRP